MVSDGAAFDGAESWPDRLDQFITVENDRVYRVTDFDILEARPKYPCPGCGRYIYKPKPMCHDCKHQELVECLSC